MLQMCQPCTDGDGEDAEVLAAQGQEIPLDELPDLPARGYGYWTEPIMGICVVTFLSLLLCSVVYGVTSYGTQDTAIVRMIVRVMITLEAVTAGLCVLYLLKLDNPSEIRRSRETCYPMPAEVERRLKDGISVSGMNNIPRIEGSPQSGAYCVRCLVWRPPKAQMPHHCSTCQRCVVDFDHHCGVFGRCIVNGNMPCFTTLITMLCVGIGTAMVAVCVSSTEPEI